MSEKKSPRYDLTRKTKRSAVKTISREDLKAKIDRGDDFVLLEVLSEESYKRGHLPGAIRFPGRANGPTFLPDKTTEIVAYCSSFT